MGKIAQLIEDGLAQILLSELVDADRSVDGINTNDDIFVAYFNTCLLFPKPQKYYVHIHRDFVCPPEYKDGYEILLNKMQLGERFSGHLSRTTKENENHDLMLYDWGIYHFHLGLEVEADGYIQRTSKLLYAFIDNNNIYLLGIFDHGKWNDQDLIEMIHSYYPWSIQSWLIDAKPEIVVTADARKDLRDAKINTFITVSDGTSYMGPGWGYTAAGTSSKVRIYANDKHHECVKFEKDIIREIPNAVEHSWRVERNDDDIVLLDNMGNTYTLYNWIPLRSRIEQHS